MYTRRSQFIEPLDRIIWSADVADEDVLMVALSEMPLLRKIKIDRLFLEGRDLLILDRLREMGLDVFDDAKIAEVPSKLEQIARKHLQHRPWMLNCMAGNVSSRLMKAEEINLVDGLKRFADACREVGTRPCGVTVLTSKKEEVVSQEYGGRSSVDQVLWYVGLLVECGFTDVVCSPREVSHIRAERQFDGIDLNTPGVRLPGTDSHDQARTDTPDGAVAAGATRLVIGRDITNGNSAHNLEVIAARLPQAA